MPSEFENVEWDPRLVHAARVLVRLAIEEDFGDERDWTTRLLVPASARGEARIVARQAGVVAGMMVVELVLDELNAEVNLTGEVADGTSVEPRQTIGILRGGSADILVCERILLNFLGRLSGIASLTRLYVDAVAGTKARIYDTRKTTPGWRLLEKFAVRCGGGWNHRLGLHRAVMLKDNHLACAGDEGLDIPAAIEKLRAELSSEQVSIEALEVEVDSIDQLRIVLPAKPDIVLLDNMSPDLLREAVDVRNQTAPDVVLEASGGVNLDTVGPIAQSGVDRISCGSLTHSAPALDIGLDWSNMP